MTDAPSNNRACARAATRRALDGDYVCAARLGTGAARATDPQPLRRQRTRHGTCPPRGQARCFSLCQFSFGTLAASPPRGRFAPRARETRSGIGPKGFRCVSGQGRDGHRRSARPSACARWCSRGTARRGGAPLKLPGTVAKQARGGTAAAAFPRGRASGSTGITSRCRGLVEIDQVLVAQLLQLPGLERQAAGQADAPPASSARRGSVGVLDLDIHVGRLSPSRTVGPGPAALAIRTAVAGSDHRLPAAPLDARPSTPSGSVRLESDIDSAFLARPQVLGDRQLERALVALVVGRSCRRRFR